MASSTDRSNEIGNRFSECQIAILQAFYKKGMNATGQQYSSDVLAASKKTGLTTQQVKVKLPY